MNDFWIVYDLASGEERWRGSGSVGSAAQQQLPEGLGVVIVPQAALVGAMLDLSGCATRLLPTSTRRPRQCGRAS